MKSFNIARSVCAVALSAACLTGLAACSSSGSQSNDQVAATVNGTEISEQTVTDYIQNFRTSQNLTDDDSWGKWMAQYSLDPSSVRDEVISYYEDIELTKQAADENGVSVSDDDVDAQVEQMKSNYSDDDAWNNALQQAGTTEDQYRESVRQAMLESALKDKVASDNTDPSDDDLLTYAQQYASAFSGAKKSSQILFSSDDEATAQEVLDKINSGELSFEDAVQQYSTDDASKADGGNVGWDLLNQFVSEYTDALANLSEGQVSGLVKSDYGIHIIKCTEVYTAPDEVTSLDQVPPELVEYLRSMVKSSNEASAYQTWFQDYKNQADIQKNDMPSGLPYDVDMSQYQSDDSSSSSSSTDATTSSDTSSDASSAADSSSSSSADASSSSSDASSAIDASSSSSSASAPSESDSTTSLSSSAN
ncbi:MAG: peptidylprolyl isomerase [Eggerthellaceae bacterium]|jgi:foldase protein PrsA|nr:peptidylprolyl isomerase [Eggerthellaceae bacterium]